MIVDSHNEHLQPVNKIIKEYMAAWSLYYLRFPEWVNYCEDIAAAHYSGSIANNDNTIYLSFKSQKNPTVNAKQTRNTLKSKEPGRFYDANETVKKFVAAIDEILKKGHKDKYLNPLANHLAYNRQIKQTADFYEINEATLNARLQEVKKTIRSITLRADQKV